MYVRMHEWIIDCRTCTVEEKPETCTIWTRKEERKGEGQGIILVIRRMVKGRLC